MKNIYKKKLLENDDGFFFLQQNTVESDSKTVR